MNLREYANPGPWCCRSFQERFSQCRRGCDATGWPELNESIHWVGASKSSFFRAIHHFNFLAETVVSDLKAGAYLGRNQHVRIWSAGCSTGEEAYSIAISLLEALREVPGGATPIYRPGGWQIEVVASDVDSESLATAAEGIYSEDALAAMPDDTKKRYFLRGRGETTGQVRVKQGLAGLVHFHRVDLEDIEWTITGPFDVIFFRNGLASMPRQARELCLRTMLLYLNPHGYLMLDPLDPVPWLQDAVLTIGNGIYQLRPHGKARYKGRERRENSRQRRRPE